MEREQIIGGIISYINNDMGYPVQLSETSHLSDDAGLDSLDGVDLLGYIEDTYNIDMDPNELKSTIGKVADRITELQHGS